MVNVVEPGDPEGNTNSKQTRILNDLLLHRDVVCTSCPTATDRSGIHVNLYVREYYYFNY